MAVRCSCTALLPVLFCFMICQLCYGTVTDIQCVKKLKASVDPDNRLEWTFNNNTEESICGFNGVDCWHPNENRVLLLHLGSFGLKDQFPDELENCNSMAFKGGLVDWITYLSNNSILQDAVDKSLTGKDNDAELLQCLKVACSCVLSSPKERPTMFEVYQLLRALGEKYHFNTADDELTMQPQNANPEDKLIVAN